MGVILFLPSVQAGLFEGNVQWWRFTRFTKRRQASRSLLSRCDRNSFVHRREVLELLTEAVESFYMRLHSLASRLFNYCYHHYSSHVRM